MVANLFSLHMKTIQRIQNQRKYSENENSVDVSQKKTKKQQNKKKICGRKIVEINTDQIREIPLHQQKLQLLQLMHWAATSHMCLGCWIRVL